MHMRSYLFLKMSLRMWISHKRRFMEWKRPLKQRQPSEGGSALQKLSDWLKMQRRL